VYIAGGRCTTSPPRFKYFLRPKILFVVGVSQKQSTENTDKPHSPAPPLDQTTPSSTIHHSATRFAPPHVASLRPTPLLILPICSSLLTSIGKIIFFCLICRHRAPRPHTVVADPRCRGRQARPLPLLLLPHHLGLPRRPGLDPLHYYLTLSGPDPRLDGVLTT
jgi:hypothetical protein